MYETTLGSTKVNKVKSTCFKLRFHVCEKEEIEKFRNETAGHVASLKMLLNATNW